MADARLLDQVHSDWLSKRWWREQHARLDLSRALFVAEIVADFDSPDVRVVWPPPLGSIVEIIPISDEGLAFARDFVDDDAEKGSAVLCEHRYAVDIVQGMLDEGLRVHGERA